MNLETQVKPYDLEQSILRPQYDTLCGDIVSRLAVGPLARKGSNRQASDEEYEKWNDALAKKVSVWYKQYLSIVKKHSEEMIE